MKFAAEYSRVFVVAVALALCGLAAYQIDATTGTRVKYYSLKGLVTDTHNRPIVGATVYFIDSSTISTATVTPADILSGASEVSDQPLESIINNAVLVKTLPQAKTNKKGQFAVKKLNGNTTYYPFVVPADKDATYLSGGDASRIAFTPKALSRSGLHINMSWSTPSGATYIGTSACYACHGPNGPGPDETSNKHHGHQLMFHQPGRDTANQDAAGHVGSSWNDLTNKFTFAYQTAPNTKPIPISPSTTLETLYFQDYDSTQSSANQFNIYENTPSPLTQVYVKAYLWITSNANGAYNVTLENSINPADPNNFITMTVPLTMGGYIRQRLLLTPPGCNGLYAFITYYALTGSASQGLQVNYDRTRKPFTPGGTGGGGFSNFFTASTTVSKNLLNAKFTPAQGGKVSTEQGCAICHLGAGSYKSFTDPVTQEALALTVSDPNGTYPIGGPNSNAGSQDIGISCEQCHGPGSQHRAEALKGLTPATTSKGKKPAAVDYTGKFIVNPALLCADRASLICGRCHGGGSITDEINNFPPPGISRAQYLTYLKAPTNLSLWPDNLHNRTGHGDTGQTYQDYLCSMMSHNARQLVACDDCHDAMGGTTFRYYLQDDPDDPNSTLCQRCHAIDVAQHLPQKTGSAMDGDKMACRKCHMTRTAKGGAGAPGLILGTPASTPFLSVTSDANIYYWQGDKSSHIWDVPSKFSAGVAGVQPGNTLGGISGSINGSATAASTLGAMPVPYTNACGTCHDASKLQFQAPQ
ncbi:MAG: hypothetical protein ABSE73_07290 [Planctomycetota bacterium]